MALPQALVARQYWVSGATSRKIGEACGEPGNRICHQCQRKFSSSRRLRVHAPQHFLNVFCPCGEYSYQRDYVLRHQRISRCHTGYTFDGATFPEFRDLVMPHVADPRRRAVLAQGFPACRPIQEQEGEPVVTPQPAPTQPLRVVLALVGLDARDESLDLGPRPLATGRKQKAPTDPDTSDRRRKPTTAQLEEEVRHLRRRLRRCEDEMGELRRRLSRLERGHQNDY